MFLFLFCFFWCPFECDSFSRNFSLRGGKAFRITEMGGRRQLIYGGKEMRRVERHPPALPFPVADLLLSPPVQPPCETVTNGTPIFIILPPRAKGREKEENTGHRKRGEGEITLKVSCCAGDPKKEVGCGGVGRGVLPSPRPPRCPTPRCTTSRRKRPHRGVRVRRAACTGLRTA